MTILTSGLAVGLLVLAVACGEIGRDRRPYNVAAGVLALGAIAALALTIYLSPLGPRS